jgi:hypothetical protein
MIEYLKNIEEMDKRLIRYREDYLTRKVETEKRE